MGFAPGDGVEKAFLLSFDIEVEVLQVQGAELLVHKDFDDLIALGFACDVAFHRGLFGFYQMGGSSEGLEVG